jgi:hypothetical protein
MRKLKQLLLVVNSKIFVILFVSILLSNRTRVIAQTLDDSQNCPIKGYLEKSEKDSNPTFLGAKVDKLKKDQRIVATNNENINVKGHLLNLSITKYKLSGGLILKVGKGKFLRDSIFYFSIPGQINEYYKVKKQCSIKFYGYNVRTLVKDHIKKSNIQLCLTLKSADCNILFSLIINKPNVTFGQYDYF